MKRIIFSFLPILLFVCVFFLLATESGLVVCQKSVNRLSGGFLSIGQVSGRLFGDGVFTDIRFTGGAGDVAVQRLEYSWQPKKLFKAELFLDKFAVNGVVVTVKQSLENVPESADTESSAVQLPDIFLPFSLVVKDLQVHGLKIVGSDGLDLFVVDQFLLSLEGNRERLTVNEFDLQGPDVGLKLHGNIEAHRNWTLDLLGNWRLAGFGFYAMAGTFSVNGPLRNPHVEIGTHSPGNIRVVGDFINLLDKPQWTAKLTAQDVDLSTFIEYCPKIELAGVAGDLSGDFAHYRGHVKADGAWDALTGMHLESDIDGHSLGIDFKSLRIDGQESSAVVEGGIISWQDIFSWEGRFHFKNFDPSVITEELQGHVTAEFVNKGDVKEHGVVASFAIERLEGVLRDHEVSAIGNVFLTETDVHTDGLTLRSGAVAGLAHIEKGVISWADTLSWAGKVQLDRFDPSFLYAEFAGSINGEFEGEGRLGDRGVEGSVSIKKISGTLRGNELSGRGDISLADNVLKTTGLLLRSGQSELAISGKMGDRLALDVLLSSPDIGTILPKSKGSLLLRGTLKGSSSAPQLEATLRGADLSYQGDSFGQLDGEFHGVLAKNGLLTGSLAGARMVLAGHAIEKASLAVHGSLARHHLAANSSGQFGTLTFTADGRYQDAWQGEIADFLFESQRHGRWQQVEKAAITAGRDRLVLEKICLADEKSTACLGGELQLKDQFAWKVQSQMNSVPLQWINRLNLVTVPLRGLVHADIIAKGDRRRVITAKAMSHISPSDKVTGGKEAEMVPLQFAGSILSLELTDSRLQGLFDIHMQTGRQRIGSRFVLRAAVDGAGDFSTPMHLLPVEGNLEFRDFNLSTLNAFTGYGLEPSGQVSSIFALAGTLGQPKISGRLQVRDGGIELPYQGITLGNIALTLAAEEGVVQVTCSATSGPGRLSATGTVQYGPEGVEGKLSIKGKDFLLVNLPEYVFRIDPDAYLTFTNHKGEINGIIDVPYGRITPEEMNGSISASEDVVFVNDTNEEQSANWPFNLNINVRLGDDVRIDGYGLSGSLGGKLRVNTTADNSLAGKGELDLQEGTFSIYGRILSIERGRVLFTGGPLDNPGIDVRAQVKVSAEEAKGDGYTVGMDISGLVQDLQYHLFSDPYMEDTEILSMMIVGHSLANSTQSEGNILEAAAVTLGVKGSTGFVQQIGSFLQLDDLHLEGSSSMENMSLVLGKHLTKDLYIGYDFNMFSQLGEFRVRYDLTKGFSVETRSSSESTGADLLYTIEK